MKIRSVECVLLSCAIPEGERWTCAGGNVQDESTWTWKRDAVVVIIRTDEGVTGYGSSMEMDPPTIAKTVSEIEPLLVGQDPLQVNRLSETGLWERWRRGRSQLGSECRALAGINIALWDILGKVSGQPIFRLLGGPYRDRIPLYASAGMWKNEPGELADEALKYKEQGFGAFKMRLGRGVQTDVEMLRAVRDAVGTDMELLADCSCVYSFHEARRVLAAIEEFDLYLWEEPIPEDDVDGYRQLRLAGRTPIAGGECYAALSELKVPLREGAYDIVQPDCTNMGLTDAIRTAVLADSHGVSCIPHYWGNGVGLAATAHFVASIPNSSFMEWDQTYSVLRDAVLKEPVITKAGYLSIPNEPGLGIQVDESAFASFPYIERPESEAQSMSGFARLGAY